ncbi:MAG TPA: hypothetical protein VFB45_10605 [Pseudolabrys sp.]|nr:hypothetical protein [Pseudolabrys sp.]
MSSKTSRDLVNRVLADLNVVGAGQDAEVEDFSDVESRVGTVVAELNSRDIMNLTDTDAIPDDLFEPLVEYLVLKAGPGYGRPLAPQAALDEIENRMREVSRATSPRRVLGTDGVLRAGNRRTRAFNFARGF